MLNIDPVVQVNVSVGNNVVVPGVFDVGATLPAPPGRGTPLTTTSRFAVYDGLAEVLSGVEGVKPAFASTTDVYAAAEKYFGVSPAPTRLVVIFYDTTEGTTETPVSAMLDAVDKGAEFYGVYYSPASGETAANIKTNTIAVLSALNGLDNGVLFYGEVGSASDLSGSGSIMYAMNSANADRAIGMACTSSADDAAGLMGLAMGYARNASTSAFALCYKSIATATVNSYTQSDVESIKGVNGNVYVSRTRTHTGLENGAVASGLRFDDVLYLDMITYDIQTRIYALIAGSTTKLPQADSTSAIFLNEISSILEDYYNIGVLADATWRGRDIGGVTRGDMIDHGHNEFAAPFATQSETDRALHKAMPITVLLCLAGSVESVVINVDVQT